MRKGVFITLISGGVTLAAHSAAACTSMPGTLKMFFVDLDTTFHHEISANEIFEKGDVFPMTVGDSCAFAMAGIFDDGIGSPVVKLENGLLVQTIGVSNSCSPQTSLAVVDCENANVAVLEGDGPNEFGSSITNYLIGHHLIPSGSIDVEGAAGIQEIVLAAEERELTVFQNSEALTNVAELLDGDQPNLFCGCQTHYPNSAGALQ